MEMVTAVPEFSSKSIKAVRLRNNRHNQRIAFVEFYCASDAAEFIDYHPYSIDLPLTQSRGIHSEPVTVGITMSRGRDQNDERYERTRGRDDGGLAGEGWHCLNVRFFDGNEVMAS